MASKNFEGGMRSSVPWVEVDSSCWSRWRYLPDRMALQFTFRESGQTYEAVGVPDTMPEFLRNTGSIGRFYNTAIKHVYNWRPVSGGD